MLAKRFHLGGSKKGLASKPFASWLRVLGPLHITLLVLTSEETAVVTVHTVRILLTLHSHFIQAAVFSEQLLTEGYNEREHQVQRP